MTDYFNPPTTCDSLDVVEQARREIDRRAWTREDGHDDTAHLIAARQYLGGYLRALEQFGLVSVTTLTSCRRPWRTSWRRCRTRTNNPRYP